MAGKRRDFTEILLVVLTVLVLLAVFAVVLAVIYPKAAREIMSDVSPAVESGEGGPVPAFTTLRRRAGEGYTVRIAPRVGWVADTLSSIFSGEEEEQNEEQKKKKKLGPVFAANTCQTGCHEHESLFDQRAFGNVYIDHRLHDAADVSCRECHFDINHKDKTPKPVKQSTCINCHKKVKATTECDSCHPPGSLLDKEIVTSEKTQEFLAGSSAGSNSLVPASFGTPRKEWLEGKGEVPCRQCHDVPRFCNQCHLVFHNRVEDWVMQHGAKVLRMEYTVNGCWQCHDGNWCAGNCHKNQGVQRSRSYLPVPKLSLTID